jgi:hypothetical protein
MSWQPCPKRRPRRRPRRRIEVEGFRGRRRRVGDILNAWLFKRGERPSVRPVDHL